MMAEVVRIEPLNGSNYQSWKYNMKLVLMERGLWGFIQETEVEPDSTAQASAVNTYRLRSDKAYSLIALNVSKSLQVHISSITDPRLAWETLRKQFEFVSIAQVVRLNRRFYAATLEEGADLLEHLTRMTSLAEQLKELKEEITPTKFATVILGSLPESYDGFISSLNARDAGDLDWENIKGLLMEEDMKRREKIDKQRSSSNDALFTNKGFSGNKGRNNRQNSKPKFHKGFRNVNGNARDGSVENKGPQCYSCHRFGHIAKYCLLNKKSGQSNIAADSDEKKTEEQLCEFRDIALASTVNFGPCSEWFIDSGATKHMTFQRNLLSEYREFNGPTKIYLGDDRIISAIGEGKVKLECHDGKNPYILTLQKVLFVPELTKNLLSVPAMAENGAEVYFDKDKCVVSKNQQTVTIGRLLDDKLYRLNTAESANLVSSTKPDLNLWHCRFGHLNVNYIDCLAKKGLVNGLEYSNGNFDKNCDGCALGKMCRNTFPKKSQTKTSRPLELIHSDVCGPMNVDSIGGSKYMLTFTDDFTRYVTVYFITSKAEVLSKFKEYINMMENKTGSHVGKFENFSRRASKRTKAQK